MSEIETVKNKENTPIDYDSYIENTDVKSNDPIEKLKKQAKENLERLGGLPGAKEIMQAFQLKDDTGKRMTVIDIKKNFFDLTKNQATHGYSIMTTMEPAVQLEQCGGYITVVLKFDYARNPEMDRLWHLLEDYGKEQAELSPTETEVPVLSLSVVPMLLGGQYGMIAHDPIFYHMQPSEVMQDYCDQIRIVFEPDSVAFLRDETFASEDVVEEIKREMAAEQLAAEAEEKQRMEDEAFEKERDKELEEYRNYERENRRHFDVSNRPDQKFQDSIGLRGQ